MSQNTEAKVYSSITQCANATGIPRELLQLAKIHPGSPKGLDGYHSSGRIYWTEDLSTWIDEHRSELENVSEEDLEHWKIRRERANALLAEIELEEKQGSIVNKALVHDWAKRISHAQSVLINSRLRQELLPKMEGKNLAERGELMDAALSEVFAVTQRGVDEWK